MTVSQDLSQSPAPGKKQLVFRGDTITFRLHAPGSGPGSAWLRTSLGRAGAARREVISHVEQNEAILYLDWSDIPMVPAGDGCFEATLGLTEAGHFEAKAFFLPEGKDSPVWPPGPNTVVNVEPAETVCGNIIYNAFVRQFGPNKHRRQLPPADLDFKTLDRQGYTVIPPSGKFRDLIRELDFIIGHLGCPYIQLLPVHPTPTTYGRMGRFGSPYAAQSFTAVDPAMAEFDPAATPLEQFMELVDAIHARRGRLLLDIAINHTGWGAILHETHPEWLHREKDGRIQMPGAWGVVWEDLTKLDYKHRDLWQYMAEMFLTWCRRGADGFRCDAGYMIPVAAWRYIIARVREQFPDTLFFLEGLGGKISVTRDILDTANFNWAYSELFQNYDRDQVMRHMALVQDIAATDGQMIHFAETHDNNRLASVSKRFARMRTALAALLSVGGGFAFANGVEWFATEKIDVHGSPALNWGAEENQVDHIRRLNAVLKTHPAFAAGAGQRFVMAKDGNFTVLLRHDRHGKNRLLVAANLDADNEVLARWEDAAEPMADGFFLDLISEAQIRAEKQDDCRQMHLAPGQVLCLSAAPGDLQRIKDFEQSGNPAPASVTNQQMRAAALEVFAFYHGTCHLNDFDPDAAAKQLCDDPEGFLRQMNPESLESRAIVWQWPEDAKRQVMIPPGHFLLVRACSDFRLQLRCNNRVVSSKYALRAADGTCFVLICPRPPAADHQSAELSITLYSGGESVRKTGSLLYLAPLEKLCVPRQLERSRLIDRPFMFLATNGRGAMMRASTYARRMRSRYDGLLAANLDADAPVDRWIMLSRCRIWLVYQGYAQAVRTDCLRRFFHDYDSRACWQYRIPIGLGRHIRFSLQMEMLSGENRVRFHFFRDPKDSADQLEDGWPVRMILRPDIENRSFHDVTKAFAGPEHNWPGAVEERKNGFCFRPDTDHGMVVTMPGADFVREPEWQYMEYRPMEAERGLDPNSDLFSPGYFTCRLAGGGSMVLEAFTDPAGQSSGQSRVEKPDLCAQKPAALPVKEALQRAMAHYVVARQGYASVIAGYPWFLDWGRDSLIFCRALIAAGEHDKAANILQLFGQYEKDGTLPNMIHGHDAGNRDTSDAPLWFAVACRDLAEERNSVDFLDEPFEGRTLRQILFSIVSGYIRGTPNGIGMDPQTGLVFSPAHFTWMDTNYPAATPRQGYPVEIQALWYAALVFVSGLTPPQHSGIQIDLKDCSQRVAKSILRCYFDKKQGYLSDCLQCDAGTRPDQAAPDDAMRPNQLFALTLGAVTDPEICRCVLEACSRLLVPGAIRSLADQPVIYPLEIRHHDRLLADAYHPYQGRYQGDEDTSRKPAYHNGTAWTWVFPSFCEAWATVYGEKSIATAQNWLGSSTCLINEGCLGHVPEILDGDYPHAQRGCDAQAWGASELFRVLRYLEKASGKKSGKQQRKP